VQKQPIVAPSKVNPSAPPEFDAIVMRGLQRDPAQRYPSAREMALDIERCTRIALASEVGAWVESLAHAELTKRAALLSEIENASPQDEGDAALSPSATETPLANVSNLSPSLHSEVAPVAVTGVVTQPARARRRRLAAAAGVLGVALVIALSALLSGGPAAGGSSMPRLAAAPSFPRVTLKAVEQPSAAPEPAQAPAPPSATPSAKATPSVQAGQAPRGMATKQPKKVNCNPPYTIDHKGHKRYKAACL
jgi:eukaryotic-like serine/threonine-protein kinase